MEKVLFSEQSQFNALKIFKHTQMVSDIMRGKTTFPVSVDLSVTNFCNHRCVWCYYRGYLEAHRVMLDKKILIKLIDELSLLGVKGINFTGGGEPLTHPALVEAMEYAHSKGIDVGLITNGVLFDEDKIKRLTKIARFIRVSLSSSEEDSYIKFQKAHKGDFKKLTQNLEWLGKYAKKTECLTGVLFLLEPNTQPELLKTISLAKKAGLKFFEARLIKTTSAFNPKALTGLNKLLFDKAKKYADENFDVILREELIRAKPGYGKSYKTCYSHEFVTSISAEGDVYICCEFEGRKEFAFGNVKNEPFKKIWLSDKRNKVIKNLKLSRCFACCKGDGINHIFQTINNIKHANFL